MERAGIDIITDGEMRRESYSNRFATALDGIDLDDPAPVLGGGRTARAAHRREDPPQTSGRDRDVLSACHRRPTKITLPGPFTMAQQAQNDFYKDEERWRWILPPRSTPSCAI